jgi:uncharacterized membrane protein YbhN (UPF0104 family)
VQATQPTVALSLPRDMKIQLVQASAVRDNDLLNLLIAVVLALSVAFGTAYFNSHPRAKDLLWETIGWIALFAILVAALIVRRLKLREETYEVPLDLRPGYGLTQTSGRPRG